MDSDSPSDFSLPSELDRSDDRRPACEKVREFPDSPGVYLMKDERGRVIYVGKARSLRSRAGSYFSATAAKELRTAELVKHIADIDFIPTDSEVDALLLEARLVKDIQPRFNIELKDDKSFPYLQIITNEEYPRIEFTRTPKEKGVRLYGPFAGAKSLRGAISVLQRIFKFRNCELDITSDDPKWQQYRPCILYHIKQCTAPCNLRVSPEDYRKQIDRLRMFLDGKKQGLLDELRSEMQSASKELQFEVAAQLRDEIHLLETLNLRGDLEANEQPEVFFVVDPKKGMKSLKKSLELTSLPRHIEGIDIAHLQGQETVASLVCFLDGIPFKSGYKKFRIKTVAGVDDFASIKEVITRRFREERLQDWPMPDLLMIDGGKGQLASALDGFRELAITPPPIVALAKREELLYVPDRSDEIRLSRHNAGLRLLQSVRDEAHRFARLYHHLLRKKKQFEQDPARLPPKRTRRPNKSNEHVADDSSQQTPDDSAD